jgi:hypothetical protein
MSHDQPEWLSLPEAVQALHWLAPDVARRLIGEALAEGRLQDRPTPLSDDPHFLNMLAADGYAELVIKYRTESSTGPGAWRRWIKENSIDWAAGEVRRARLPAPYRPQLSRSALLKCFPEPAAPKNKGGAPFKEDWSEIKRALMDEIKTVGFPQKDGEPGWRTQTDVMLWVSVRLEGEVHKNTLQKHVRRMLAEIRHELRSTPNN